MRNINDGQRAYLIGKRYKEEKKSHGGDRKSIRQNDGLIETAKKIAEQNQSTGRNWLFHQNDGINETAQKVAKP